jgi:hypothetical protein
VACVAVVSLIWALALVVPVGVVGLGPTHAGLERRPDIQGILRQAIEAAHELRRGTAMAAGRNAMVVLGAFMQIFSFIGLFGAAFVLVMELSSSPNDGPPMCDGKEMYPGARCHIYSDSKDELVGYDEMVRRKENSLQDSLTIAAVSFGGGTVLALGGRWLCQEWLFGGSGRPFPL